MINYEIQTQSLYLILAGLLVLALGTANYSAEPDGSRPARKSGESVKPYPESMNKEFVDPHADIKRFVHKFENDDREVYDKEITAAGFARVETKLPPALRDNFYGEYRRTADRRPK